MVVNLQIDGFGGRMIATPRDEPCRIKTGLAIAINKYMFNLRCDKTMKDRKRMKNEWLNNTTLHGLHALHGKLNFV